MTTTIATETDTSPPARSLRARQQMIMRELHALGDNPDAVAASLRAAHIRGRRVSSDGCPLAVWASALMDKEVILGSDSLWLSDRYPALPLPDPVVEFIHAFDRGAYSNLLSTR